MPIKLLYRSDYYVSPWFYQYFAAFAPDPPLQQKIYTYRLNIDGVWSNWETPASAYLEQQWHNRFTPDIKVHDMLEAIAINIYLTVINHNLDVADKEIDWKSYPAIDAAFRFVRLKDAMRFGIADSIQIGINLRDVELNGDSLGWNDDQIIVAPIVIDHE